MKVKFEDLITNTNETYVDLINFLNIRLDSEYLQKISNSKFKINSSFNEDRSLRKIDQSTLNRSNQLNSDEKNKINQKLSIIDTSFYTEDVFDLDLKMNDHFIKNKKKNFKNLLSYLLQDLKFFYIVKIFYHLILFSIKRLLNKFFN